MTCCRIVPRRLSSPPGQLLILILLSLTFTASGCKRHVYHTSDFRLRKIDEMLSAQLPPGVPRSLVQNFLKSRGYQFEAPPDRESLQAVIRHVDTDTLEPAVARAIFRFDSNGRLTTFELKPAPDIPLMP